jgi:hypothetical protein
MKLSVCLDGNNGTFGARMRKISFLIGTAAKAAVRSARSKSPLSALVVERRFQACNRFSDCH